MKIKKLIPVMIFAAMTTFACKAQETPNVTQISWDETKTAMAEKDLILVDVRTPEEYAAGTVQDAKNIDFMGEDFKKQFSKFNKENPIYIFCQSGNRSGKASKVLSEMGFEEIYDIEGGYLKWEE